MNKIQKIILSVSVIVVILLSGFLIKGFDILKTHNDNVSNKNASVKMAHKNRNPLKIKLFGPKIIKNKTQDVKLETYDNGVFSMQIPQGWKVDIANADYIHYTFMVYNPQNPDYRIFFNMKSEGYIKTQQMKNWYLKYYNTPPMSVLPVINPQTTEAFYKVYTKAFSIDKKAIPFQIPIIKNFKVINKLGKNATGGEIVRAIYTNENGKIVDGIFTTTIKELSLYFITVLNVYNTVFFTTPEYQLTEWLPILNKCVSTINFSDKFISGYYGQQNQILKNAQELNKIGQETSDIITSGWNARQKTYDILSQKRSDATMGYERVYDTETNEIYKAELGFTDVDTHGRFEPITDDMYNLPTSGYIERK